MQPRVITYSRNVFLPLTSVCRNRCGYCSFRTPVQDGCLMLPDEVEAILRRGSEQGCTEALFTFGEHPEEEPGFEVFLEKTGYATILEYCEAMCRLSIHYGILPHTNAGVLTYDEMKRLRKVNASMGLMLETTARIPAHNGSKGKSPEVRLAMMEDAGKLRIPFTTGLLLGIGETVVDREESLVAIRDIHRKYGNIQEIILQNFCPKDNTPMAAFRVPETREIANTIRMARRILPEEISIQIAPNLIEASRLIGYGVNDLGGVSPVTIDYVNPEHPWPALEELKTIVGDATLRERLCIYPRFIEMGWYDPGLQPLINRLGQSIKGREQP
ncbi:MAG: 7,8-didemethyl-8-hydroxy-5-deazariboflavin synthase CofG [Methanoregula sp.]|nr:7,8-didemethyl-8-hydroxy-5-deazariboflavin synthase CofG [Methanoregula sp.]